MDEFKKYRIFRRTYWTSITAKIIRPYWDGDKIDGYIIELTNGQQLAIPKNHIKTEYEAKR